MAKGAKTLNDALNELVKDYENVLKVAVEYASDKAKDDIYKYSISCLEEYYDNYTPSSYERTDSLRHAIAPYSETHMSSGGIVNRVGVEYNPFVLEAYVSGNPAYVGSSSYGQIDAWYVLDNYLEGIHPATNGSSNPDTVEYFEIRDPISPTQKMETYLDKYAKTTFQNNILISFAKQLKSIR